MVIFGLNVKMLVVFDLNICHASILFRWLFISNENIFFFFFGEENRKRNYKQLTNKFSSFNMQLSPVCRSISNKIRFKRNNMQNNLNLSKILFPFSLFLCVLTNKTKNFLKRSFSLPAQQVNSNETEKE